MKNENPELVPQEPKKQIAMRNSLIVSEELIEKGNHQTVNSKASAKPTEKPRDEVVAVVEETLPLSEYIVCSGAKCQCTGNPSVFSTLSIKTHQKYYANAVDKLVATIEDNQFEEGLSPFKLCKHKKGNDKTCTYQAEGFWKVKENDHFPLVGHKDVLTETGKLRCVIGGALSIFTHGQTVSITEKEVEEIKEVFPNLPALNGLLDFDALLDTSDEVTYVSNVNRLELINTPHIKIGALADGGSQALRVLKGEQLSFKATTPSNQSGRYISWSVTEALPGSTLLDVGKTGQSITLEITSESATYNAVGTTSRTFSVTPTQVGTFLVSAARKPKDQEKKSYYATFYYYLEVVEHATIQALELSRNAQEVRRGDEVVFTIHSDVELPEAQLDLLSLRVTVQSAHEADNIAVIYRAKGSPALVQEGNKIKATFTCSNINVYRVQVYYNNQPLSEIPMQTFEVTPNKVLSFTPKVERIRLGSEVVFTAQLLDEKNINPSAVNWRIKAPNSSFFRDYFVKNKIVNLSFPQVGKYEIECVYGSFAPLNKKYRQTIEVVDNAVERINLTPSVVPPKGETIAHGVYRKQMFTVALVLPLGYQPPTDGAVYVEKNEIERPGFFKKIWNKIAQSKPASTIPRITNNRDTEISWRLSYVKGPKKKNGLNFYINYPHSLEEGEFSKETAVETQQEDYLEPQQLEGIFISRISTDKEEIELRSTIATLDFQLEEQGTYQLEVTVNGSSLSCEIECIEGRVNRWEFVDSYDQPIHYLSFYEDFTIATALVGFENTQASIAYWYDYRNRKKEVLELYRDTISFDSNGKGTHTVKKSSEFWKNFARKAPEGKGDEYAVFFTISEEIGLSNVKRNLFNNHEALEGFIFPLDTSNTYALISKSLRFEAYFNKENHQRLVEPRLYGQPVEVQVRRILGRYTSWASAPDALTLTIYENMNLNLFKLEFADRKATSMDLKIEKDKNTVYTPMLNTCEDAVYKESTHEKDRESKIQPRVFYMGISYEIEEEVSYWGLKQIKKKVIEELFPRGYTRTLANNDLLVNPLKSEIEADLSEKNREKRIKQNEETIARYRAEGKFGHRYLHQLKLVKEIAFGQAFTDKKIPVKVERAPHRLPDAVSHEKCPNCNKPVTVDQLKQLFKTTSTKNISDESLLKEIAASYNKYREKMGMNTCYDKAYFFAVLLVETGFIHKWKDESGKTIEMMENFNYYKGADALNQLGAFKTYPEMKEKLGRQYKDKGTPGYANLTTKEQARIANFAYSSNANSSKAKELGNTAFTLTFINKKVVDTKGMSLLENEKADGWKYRGRGYFQLTGKDAYTKINGWMKSLTDTPIDIVQNPDLVGNNVEIATLSAMLFYAKYKKLTRYSKSLSSAKVLKGVGADITVNDRQGQATTNHKLKSKVFHTKETIEEVEFPSVSEVFLVSSCLNFRELRIYSDILTYHIYASGEIHKKIPKVDKHPSKVRYRYYDKDGKAHELGVYEWFEVDELNSPTNAEVEDNYADTYTYPSNDKIDGKTAYYYKDKQGNLNYIITESKENSEFPIMKYKVKSGKKAKLIPLESPWKKGVEGTAVYFKYTFVDTARTYCGLDQYAVFAGAFFDLNLISDGTGIASIDGTGYPSKSHVNGRSLDIDYFSPVSETTKMIDAMKKFGCQQFYVGLKSENSAFEGLVTHGQSIQVGISSIKGHSSHLHCGPINNNHIIVAEEEEEENE